MKTYITFGQNHIHRINNKTFDCNCVAVIESPDATTGRKLAFDFFGPKFCFEYSEDQWDEKNLHYFPRGYINVNF